MRKVWVLIPSFLSALFKGRLFVFTSSFPTTAAVTAPLNISLFREHAVSWCCAIEILQHNITSVGGQFLTIMYLRHGKVFPHAYFLPLTVTQLQHSECLLYTCPHSSHTVSLLRLKRRSTTMMRNATLVARPRNLTNITSLASMHQKLTRNPLHQLRNSSVIVAPASMVRTRPLRTHSDWPRVTVLISDNYCVPKWVCLENASKRKLSDFKCKDIESDRSLGS